MWSKCFRALAVFDLRAPLLIPVSQVFFDGCLHCFVTVGWVTVGHLACKKFSEVSLETFRGSDLASGGNRGRLN